MAVDGIVTVNPGPWMELTNGPATSITVIHLTGGRVYLKPMPSAVPPSIAEAGIVLRTTKDLHNDGFIKTPLKSLTHQPKPERVFARALLVPAKLYVETD